MNYMETRIIIFQQQLDYPNAYCLDSCQPLNDAFDEFVDAENDFLREFCNTTKPWLRGEIDEFKANHRAAKAGRALGRACTKASKCNGPQAGTCPVV